MARCTQCGREAGTGKFCQGCGAPIATERAQSGADYAERIRRMNDTEDTTDRYQKRDVDENRAMAILAYFGPLVLIPLFAAKGSRFARYHTNQGLVLLLAAIAYSIAQTIVTIILTAIWWRLAFIGSILSIVSIVFFVLMILGIINAANGRAKALPLIGGIRLLK